MENIIKKNGKKIALMGLVIGAIFFVFQYMLPLVAPFICSFVVIYWLYPYFYKIELKWKIKKEISMVFLLFLIIIICLIIIWGVIQILMYGMNFFKIHGNEIQKNVEEVIYTVGIFLEDKIGLTSHGIEDNMMLGIEEITASMEENLIPVMMDYSLNYGRKLLPIITFIGIFFISLILLCKDFEEIMEGVRRGGVLHSFMDFMEGFLNTIGTYVRTQLLIICIISIVSTLILGFSGISGGWILGILTGLLDALPFIGAGLVLLPTGLWQLVNGNIGNVIICVILYVICIAIREWLEPKLMGNKLGIPPVFILLSLYAGVQLFGISGIIKGPLVAVLLKLLFVGESKV
ncbi:MAG: AI-2E family transporter [Eubacteriales bacterium]